MEYVLRYGQEHPWGDDVYNTCLQDHALSRLNNRQFRLLREQIDHHAVVQWIEVEDQYERGMQVFGHTLQQGCASFQTASRCAYGNDGEFVFCFVIMNVHVFSNPDKLASFSN